MKLTIDWLKQQEQSCIDGIVRGKQEWPDGMELSVENLQRAIDLEIGIEYFERVLTGENRKLYFSDPSIMAAKESFNPITDGTKADRTESWKRERRIYMTKILPMLYKALKEEVDGK